MLTLRLWLCVVLCIGREKDEHPNHHRPRRGRFARASNFLCACRCWSHIFKSYFDLIFFLPRLTLWDDRLVHRLRLLSLASALAGLAAPAAAVAATSHVELWTALSGQITCGVAIHVPGTPATQILCSSTAVPAPKGHSIGDPGFVFLPTRGRPSLARLSQDSFQGINTVVLTGTRTWRRIGAITCTLSASAVRCTNRSRHGFTISRTSYRAF
jgi:hypothetical protein